jgi:hypothetical protein
MVVSYKRQKGKKKKDDEKANKAAPCHMRHQGTSRAEMPSFTEAPNSHPG